MAFDPNKQVLNVSPKVSWGLTSTIGVLAALGQYFGSLATILVGGLTPESVGLIATATATLIFTIKGRMDQATAAAASISPGEQTLTLPAVSSITEPEPNVLYLDGQQIAREVVKSLNTRALLAQMNPTAPPIPAASEPTTSTPTAVTAAESAAS